MRILHLGGLQIGTSAQNPMKFKELRYLEVCDDVSHLQMKVEGLHIFGWYQGPIPKWHEYEQGMYVVSCCLEGRRCIPNVIQ